MGLFYSLLLSLVAILLDGGLLIGLFQSVLKSARCPETVDIFLQVAIAQAIGWLLMLLPIPYIGLIAVTAWLAWVLSGRWELEPRDVGIALVVLLVANYLVLSTLGQMIARMQMAAAGL